MPAAVRVLFLLTYYHPHWTGLTAYARRTAEGLAARGHEVSVLTTRHSPDLPAREVVNGVVVHRADLSLTVSRSAIALSLLPRLARMLGKVDAVSIHIPYPEVLPATLLARARGVSVFITHNGDLVLPKEWQLVGAVEALTGILMCGWSTGFFFVVVSRMFTTVSRPVNTPI